MSSSGINYPSIDPADLDSLTGAFRFIFNKLLQDVNGMLPAQVVSFDRTKNRVTVQPLIMVVTTGGQQVQRAQVCEIPVFQFGGGGYVLNFNLNPGDIGWILANDRDISLFLQSYQQSPPNTYRKNNFADSLFIPNVMTNYTIDSEDAENAVLQSVDGSVRVSLWPNKVKITAPDGVSIVCDGSGSVYGLYVTGNLIVTGTITAGGTITPDTPPIPPP